MIAHLSGTVVQSSLGSLVISVGGVGLTVLCTPQTALSLPVGRAAVLQTTLIVREDALTLYGFADTDERDVFEAVQTVTGVGPRTALALLATLTPDQVRQAVHSENLATLVKVPGIGRKGAQRLVLELKDKLGAPSTGLAMPADWQDDVRGGLESLGWSAKEADQAVVAVTPLAQEQDPPDVPALLRAALQTLDRA